MSTISWVTQSTPASDTTPIAQRPERCSMATRASEVDRTPGLRRFTPAPRSVAAARAASGDDRRGRRRDRTCASGSRDRPTGSATGVDRDEDRRTRPRCPRLFTHSLPRSCRTAFTTPAAQVFQVEKGDRPAAGELRERAVPALDRLVLDEERREGLLQELVRLGLRLGLDQRRLCVPLGLGDLR